MKGTARGPFAITSRRSDSVNLVQRCRKVDSVQSAEKDEEGQSQVPGQLPCNHHDYGKQAIGDEEYKSDSHSCNKMRLSVTSLWLLINSV